MDVVVTRSLAWRVADVAYTHSWLSNADRISAENGLKISSEVVLRIGAW